MKFINVSSNPNVQPENTIKMNNGSSYEHSTTWIEFNPTCTYTPKFVGHEKPNFDTLLENPRVVLYEKIDRIIEYIIAKVGTSEFHIIELPITISTPQLSPQTSPTMNTHEQETSNSRWINIFVDLGCIIIEFYLSDTKGNSYGFPYVFQKRTRKSKEKMGPEESEVLKKI